MEESDRAQALRRLMAALREPTEADIVVVGDGGSGKQHLLMEALAQPKIATLYPDGVFWLDGDRPQPWLTDDAIARRGGTQEFSGVAADSRAWLQQAHALLVVRHGRAHPTLRAELHALHPSRGRVVWLEEAPPSGAAVVITIGRLNGAEMSGLWAELGGREPIDSGTRAHLRATDGHPLSLRLLAGLLRDGDLTPADAPADAPLTPQFLLELAWRRCTPVEQRALLHARALPSGFRDGASLAVTGLASEAWASLAARGWCERLGPARWRLPRTIRRFLLQYSDLATPSPSAGWEGFLDRELERGLYAGFDHLDVRARDIATLWERCLQAGDVDGWLLRLGLLNDWARSTNNLRLSYDWNRALLQHIEGRATRPTEGAREAAGRLRFAMGFALTHLQRLALGAALVHQGLELVGDNLNLRAEGLALLASNHFFADRFHEALGALREALVLDQQIDADPMQVANHLADMAQVRLMVGELDGAESDLRRAIALKQRLRRVGPALANINALGLLLIALERVDEALGVLHDGVQQGRRLRNRTVLPYLLHSLALALLESGQAEAAYRLTTEAFHTLDARVHDQVSPLLQTTLLRTMAQSPGSNLAATDVRKLLTRAQQLGGGAAWYANLAAIDYLAGVAQRREDACAMARLLAAVPHEGHLNSIIRRTLHRLAPGTAPEAVAPTLPEVWAALAQRAPELVDPPVGDAG
jgi:tetratricopeptide (TPR) repeat protein